MFLNTLNDNKSKSKSKRVGRGTGSGIGKTSARGHKGQKSRSGSSIKGFEGGQMPIHRRLPKRGFTVYDSQKPEIVNTGRLQLAINQGKIDVNKEINENILYELGFIKKISKTKLISKGELTSKIIINIFGASSSAIKTIEKAGGKINTFQNLKKNEDKKV
tara:strand:- start:829 stop:1311 length:483 start_codon:yes stop_codon:yes gene_type:complete